MPLLQRSRAALTTLGYAATQRLLSPHVLVAEKQIAVADLPPALEGFCIAQVSDLHVGTGVWKPLHLEEAAQAINRAQPDLMVNTGDYVQGAPPLEVVEAEIAQLVAASGGAARAAILGNHDYMPGEEYACALEEMLTGRGIQVLVNRGTCVRREEGGLSVVGLSEDDPRRSFQQGLEALLAADRPRVVLVHEPDLAERLPPGSADLVLAGHTHGGQVGIPGVRRWAVRHFAESRYLRGLYRVNGMPLYVNEGLGCEGLPLRWLAPPEVTILRLTR